MKEHFFNNLPELIDQLSALLIERAGALLQSPNKEMALKGMALAGGKTPEALYKHMADKFPWEKIYLCPTDERVVPTDDPARNDVMLRNSLLNGKESEKFMCLSLDHPPVFQIDTLLLGMGEDGHFASIFPPFTPSPSDNKIVKGTAPTAPFERLSLSFDVIKSAKHIFLFITGDTKKAVYQQAKLGVNPELPVSYLLCDCDRKIDVFWCSSGPRGP